MHEEIPPKKVNPQSEQNESENTSSWTYRTRETTPLVRFFLVDVLLPLLVPEEDERGETLADLSFSFSLSRSASLSAILELSLLGDCLLLRLPEEGRLRR